MDAETAGDATKGLFGDEVRCPTIGYLLPAGFSNAVKVSELLPSVSSCQITDVEITVFAKVVTAFRSGSWDECRLPLAHLPADDRSRDFLLVQIVSQSYQPPSGWSGVIRMDSK